MTGVLILREDSRCGTQRGCWRWGCELCLIFCHLLNGILEMIRLSVPFTPPTVRYHSPEDVVKKIPNYEYQLYFANPESTKEIEAKVRGTARLRLYRRANWVAMGTQLERFLRLIFRIEVLPGINTMTGGNMREAIVNHGVTRRPTSVPPLTNDVCFMPR